jgi:hypothetical protein
MQSLSSVKFTKTTKPKKSPYLHSPANLLADELSVKLRDQKHFGFYLKMATLYDHNFLRKLAGEVLESKNVKSPGKLFAFLIKKYNEEQR